MPLSKTVPLSLAFRNVQNFVLNTGRLSSTSLKIHSTGIKVCKTQKHRCTKHSCISTVITGEQKMWRVKEKGAMIQRNETTIAVTSHVSRCRRGRSFSEARGCEGNRKLQTPAPWEREDYNQPARHPPLGQEAPGWETGKSGVSSLIMKNNISVHKIHWYIWDKTGTFSTLY